MCKPFLTTFRSITIIEQDLELETRRALGGIWDGPWGESWGSLGEDSGGALGKALGEAMRRAPRVGVAVVAARRISTNW